MVDLPEPIPPVKPIILSLPTHTPQPSVYHQCTEGADRTLSAVRHPGTQTRTAESPARTTAPATPRPPDRARTESAPHARAGGTRSGQCPRWPPPDRKSVV